MPIITLNILQYGKKHDKIRMFFNPKNVTIGSGDFLF